MGEHEIGDVFTCPYCGAADISTMGAHFCRKPLSAPVSTGWLCPACGTGNAPFVAQCPCQARQGTTTTDTHTQVTPSATSKHWHDYDCGAEYGDKPHWHLKADVEESPEPQEPEPQYCGAYETDCGYNEFECPQILDDHGRCPKHGRRRFYV